MSPSIFSRRAFLWSGGAAACAGAGAWLLPRVFAARPAREPRPVHLVADLQGILDLPPGFRYELLERAGETMSDGYRVPGRPDGMACFAGAAGTWVLMRNHELSLGELRHSPFLGSTQALPKELYDSEAVGGVSRVVVDAKSLKRVSSNLVLSGTVRNCAGGISPWGWLSCEESTLPGHGYVFLCGSEHARLAPPQPIRSYGRFNHEAAVVDPRDHVAYLTEDRREGCFYRFVPTQKSRPFEGKLQALKRKGVARFDTASAMRVGEAVEIEWVDLPESDPREDDLRLQAQERGAALVRRGEGLWWSEERVYFSATAGGARKSGQIFAIERRQGQEALVLLAEASDPERLDHPDNLSLSPWGHLFIAEDGDAGNFIRYLDERGELFTFARNALSGSELAGLCFSPDGRALFVNIQAQGLTLAITGPFAGQKGRVPV